MNRQTLRAFAVFSVLAVFLLREQSTIRGQQAVEITELRRNLLILSTSRGNVIASVGPDGALLVGALSTSNTSQINDILEKKTKSTARYVIIGPENAARSEGDAGWGRHGAFVAMQELALQRIGGDKMNAPPPLSPRLESLGVDRPRIAFSEVLAFDLNNEAIHVVHQEPGYSNADAIVHFHAAGIVYLGAVFPGDGYPLIDFSQGGTLDGLLKTLGSWTGNTIEVVPYRGKISDGRTVEAFRDMIVTVRDRIQHMISEGRTESEAVAMHPTAEFDARWGHGEVQPEAFVREIYSSLKERSQDSSLKERSQESK